MKLLKYKSQKRLHLTHGLFDPDKERTADDGVPDVELVQMWQRDNFCDVAVVNTMARIHNEAETMR